jgi:hypothetical protein
MMTFIESVNLHSTSFQPPFTMVTGALPTEPVEVPGLNFKIRRVTRRGAERAAIVPAVGESENGYFVAMGGAMATITPDGRPPTQADSATSTQHKIYYGVAALLVTNRRLCVLVVRGDTILGKVNEQRGSLLALSFAFESINSIEIARRKGAFGRVKESEVKVLSFAPPAGLLLEPKYRLAVDPDAPAATTSYSAFADILIEAACTHLLQTVTDHQEHSRLDQIRAGHRLRDGLDLVAPFRP